MDPNLCYRMLLNELDAGDAVAVSERADNLHDWIEAGGFLPKLMEQEGFTRETALIHLGRLCLVASWVGLKNSE